MSAIAQLKESALAASVRRKCRKIQELPCWKLSVIGWTKVVLAVLVTNVVVVVVVGAKYGYSDGVGILSEGDCSRSNTYTNIVSFAINALSSLLLSGSNYCLQCLTSPSRKEVDAAHARGQTLEIGVASVSNLKHLAAWKRFMWLGLVLSSVPLHLLYNSVISNSIAAYEYAVVGVNTAFLEPSGLEETNLTMLSSVPVISELHGLYQSGGLTQLSVKDCISAYAQPNLVDRSNLLLVSKDISNNGSAVYNATVNYGAIMGLSSACTPDPISWMCRQYPSCDTPCIARVSDLLNNASHWAPLLHGVDYCLSQPAEQRCQIRFSLQLGIAVIACNVIKVVLMLCLACKPSDHAFHTIGDAISSYLSKCDEFTRGCCLVSAREFREKGLPGFTVDKDWEKHRSSYSEGVTDNRWYLSLFFYWVIFILSMALLSTGIVDSLGHTTAAELFGLPLGAVSSLTTIYWSLPNDGNTGFATNAMISNLPQLCLSCAFLTYNGMLTSMLASSEWSRMAWRRKGLRVSRNPRGAQRSTYFLHLPYRYSLPLICLSITLHWLASQSFFLVTITEYNDSEEWALSDVTRYACGWSPIAALLVAIGGLVMIGGALVIGLGFHLKPGIPLNGTCSAVIAAACYADPAEKMEEPLEQQKLRWGVVGSFYPEEKWGKAPVQFGNCARSMNVAEGPDLPDPRLSLSSTASDQAIFPFTPARSVTSLGKASVSKTDERRRYEEFTTATQHCAFSSRPSDFPEQNLRLKVG